MQTHIESRVVHDQPTLTTARLTLRPFVADDAFDVERLAGRREIADTTLNIPHPYPHGGAAEWIRLHGPAWIDGTSRARYLCRYRFHESTADRNLDG